MILEGNFGYFFLKISMMPSETLKNSMSKCSDLMEEENITQKIFQIVVEIKAS
jgi:hypothetical protein